MLFKSIETVLVIFILLGTGWFMSFKGWLTKESKPFLTKLIVNIAVPAVTITNFFENFPREMLYTSWKFMVIPLITMLISYYISFLITKIIKIHRLRRGSFIAMCTVSNSIFVGLPISLGLFGEVSLPYVIFYYIVNSFVFWGICNPKIREDVEGKAGSILESIKKIFTVPLIAVIVSGTLLYFNFSPPSLVMKTAKYLGSMVTPISSILVGRIIFEMNFKEIEIDLSIILLIIMRFIFGPAIMFFASKISDLPEIATQVFTIQAAMPVMMQTTVVAESYGADSKYVATALSITTFLSLISIPVYMWIMPILW